MIFAGGTGRQQMPNSKTRIARWNARYAAGGEAWDAPPSPLLTTAVQGVRPGRALDLACGAGRHAVWLAERDWQVVAVDGSSGALELLLARAAKTACRERIEPHVADLEADPPEFDISAAAYDLVVDCQFLHRPLFPAIRDGVRRGGLLVASLHIPAAGGKRGHGYVLERGELAAMAAGWGWTVLHSVEREPAAGADHGLGVAEIIARRPR